MSDDLIMMDEGEQALESNSRGNLITIMLPYEDYELKGNMLRIPKKYILKLVANMLIQVDLDNDQIS